MMTSSSGNGRSWSLRREPKAVDEAVRFAELAVGACEPSCKEAISLAVCELAENLVKYGNASSPGAISIDRSGEIIRITTVNPVASADDAKHVMSTIARLSPENAKDLYRARLQELFTNPGLQRAQLGLLRIAFEGRFRLTCSFQASTLRIVAERHCKLGS